ncbi:MAG: phosphate signaling complex protein PhoU [Synechococcaceae cyanobacterium RL_1_2]|nr:phosphate signaling complex protein PhoU [Synechococcaceae cyanobacterium RL_1_2]
MGALVEDSCRMAHRSLFKRDLAVLPLINQLDKEIDQYYKAIEVECTKVMALQAPVAQDLRFLSAVMQLVRDLERIGDYAEDLAEKATKLFIYPTHPCMPDIEVMFIQTQLMVATSLESLADLDDKTGQKVKVLDDIVDDVYDRVYELLSQQRNIEIAEPILLLALVIRDMERMADHATNIGQRVAYIITGERN